jgi:beta-glucosidase
MHSRGTKFFTSEKLSYAADQHQDINQLKDKEFDVAILFLGTTSGEGADRKNLDFDANQTGLIGLNDTLKIKKFVVHMVSPSASVLKPIQNTDAMLFSVMPGIGMSKAITNIIFGHSNPSGKLTFTLPKDDDEEEFTPD